MTTDTGTPRAFLNHLFGGVPGWFEVTLIHPQRAKGDNILTRFYELGVDAPDWDRIAARNAEGWGCYYGTTVTAQKPRYGRRKETDVSAISCLWCEFDYQDGIYHTEDDIIQASGNYAPPTALIASGGGVHCLWRITPVDVTPDNRAAIKETLRGMAIAMKADTAATDLARILRMPSTINTKPSRNGAMCEIIDLLPGEYTLDTFAEYRQYARPIARPIQRPLPRHRPDDLPRYISDYLATPTPDGSGNRELNNAAYHMHANGYTQSEAERLLVPKAMADGYPERPAMAVVRSVFSAAPGAPSSIGKRTLTRIRAAEAVEREE